MQLPLQKVVNWPALVIPKLNRWACSDVPSSIEGKSRKLPAGSSYCGMSALRAANSAPARLSTVLPLGSAFFVA